MKSSDLGFDIPFGSKTISTNFDGGDLSSDAGLLLLREIDKKLGLTNALAGCIRDGRDQSKVNVVTNIVDMSAEDVYEFYCDRGDVENRIKELKGDLLSSRTSCHRFLANQFRLILHCAAFVLLQALRKLLAGTDFADAQVSTLRSRLLKVGVRVRETTRRIWLMLPTSYPFKEVWMHIAPRLSLARI